MSLLTRKAPHLVRVQLRRMERTPEGVRGMVPYGEIHEVRGMAEPVRDWSSSEESTSGGLQVLNLVVFRCRTWPGDVHSWIEYEGSIYDTVGAPQHHHVSKRTSHWRLTFRWLKEGTLP